MLIWTGSYAGWLPAMQILPPPQRRPARQTALEIAARLVWEVTPGFLADELLQSEQQQDSGSTSAESGSVPRLLPAPPQGRGE